MKKKFIIIGMIMMLLAGSVISWAASSASQDITISSGSSASGGGVADVTPLSDSFFVTQGKTEKISGLEMFRIDIGNASYNDDIRVSFTLLNPEDVGKVLSNPHSFIDVQVCYEVDFDEDYILNDGSTKVKKSVNSIVTMERGHILLMPTMGGTSIDEDTYWILGSITTPGGVPPGQQEQLGEMNFYCDVRL